MNRNRSEQLWNFWHYSENSTLDDDADRLYKIRPILDNCVEKFRKYYKPPQELSLDEAKTPWSGRLRFRMYNPRKVVKFVILVHMVREATTGYFGNMELYTAEGKKLEETIFSVLETYIDLWQHVYQDNHYNSVETVEKLLLRKTQVCRTIRANRGILKSLIDSTKN
jgi:hypothetical protein